MKRWVRQRLGQEIVVHTTEDDSYKGILDAEYTDGLVLRATTRLGAEPVSLPGELFVPRDKVALIQRT